MPGITCPCGTDAVVSYLEWQRATRQPSTVLPPLSCDCALHVFDPAQAHRLLPGRRYDPPLASLADMRAMHRQLGVERAVLVQPSVYGFDHTVMIAALRSDPERCRGVALLDDSLDDRALRALHDAGVRSARFNILSRFGQPFDEAAFRRQAARAVRLGWSISLHATLAELAQHAALLLSLDAPVIVDHGAYFDPRAWTEPAADFLREALSRGHWWVKLSRLDHRSRPPYDDVVAIMRALVGLDATRMLWATDWPHPLYDAAASVMPNDADLVDLLVRAVPDASVREQVLVRNPAGLFGFSA